MAQQQIQVSISVGTKLLVSIVLSLSIVITFLSISTILLFREDKRAYTYRGQYTEVLLAGRDFVGLAKHTLEILRSTLVSVDPRLNFKKEQEKILRNIINNQNEIFENRIYLVHLNTGALKSFSTISHEKLAKELDFKPSDYDISSDAIMHVLPELLKHSFAFLNLTKMGGPPILAVIFADTQLKNHPGGVPISVGLITLKQFGSELGKLHLTIATRLGQVLYDTDHIVNSSQFGCLGHPGRSDHLGTLKSPLFQKAMESGLSSGAQEFYWGGRHYLGSYIDPGLNLLVLTQVEWKNVMRSTYVLIEKLTLLGSIAVGAAIIFAILFSKTLIAPLESLYQATREVAKGNFLVALKEGGRDELGALSSSFNIMSHKIHELVEESKEQVQLENEVAIASTVQQTLIPPAHFHNEWLDIWSHYQAASKCGGDWWGFFWVGKKVALMIADATGHGFPSALITASARSCFSVMHQLAVEDPAFSFSPNKMLHYANRVIFDASLGKILMTFFIGVIDFETQMLTYASAGHNPPWLFKKTGDEFILKSLIASGPRLGESEDVLPFIEKTVPISPGDLLFLYTDGLMEGKNTLHRSYGKKRARQWVEAHLKSGPQELIRQLTEDFFRYNDGKPLDDDMTVAAVHILSGKHSSGQS